MSTHGKGAGVAAVAALGLVLAGFAAVPTDAVTANPTAPATTPGNASNAAAPTTSASQKVAVRLVNAIDDTGAGYQCSFLGSLDMTTGTGSVIGGCFRSWTHQLTTMQMTIGQGTLNNGVFTAQVEFQDLKGHEAVFGPRQIRVTASPGSYTGQMTKGGEASGNVTIYV